MSFEIKYDNEGQPLPQQQPPESPESSEEPVEMQASPSQEPAENISTQQQAQRKTPQDSFRELKEKALRAERERDEALRYVQQLQAQNKPQQPVEEDNEINIGPDDLAEGKHLTKIGRKYKKLEQELNQYKQQTAEALAEARLKAQFPDFDKVVTAENLAALQAQKPHLAASIHAGTDIYSKAVAAYEVIKLAGIGVEDPYAADKLMVQKNAAKPRPLASVSPQQGDSPLTRANAFANGLTKELQDQLIKEMQEARRNR